MLNPDAVFPINMRKSETARRNILRGLNLGESTVTLLIAAIKCIAEMTGDEAFLPMCEKTLHSVYGAGLDSTDYKAYRISELEASTKNLEESLRTCTGSDTRGRLLLALRLQKRELESLKKAD